MSGYPQNVLFGPPTGFSMPPASNQFHYSPNALGGGVYLLPSTMPMNNQLMGSGIANQQSISNIPASTNLLGTPPVQQTAIPIINPQTNQQIPVASTPTSSLRERAPSSEGAYSNFINSMDYQSGYGDAKTPHQLTMESPEFYPSKSVKECKNKECTAEPDVHNRRIQTKPTPTRDAYINTDDVCLQDGTPVVVGDQNTMIVNRLNAMTKRAVDAELELLKLKTKITMNQMKDKLAKLTEQDKQRPELSEAERMNARKEFEDSRQAIKNEIRRLHDEFKSNSAKIKNGATLYELSNSPIGQRDMSSDSMSVTSDDRVVFANPPPPNAIGRGRGRGLRKNLSKELLPRAPGSSISDTFANTKPPETLQPVIPKPSTAKETRSSSISSASSKSTQPPVPDLVYAPKPAPPAKPLPPPSPDTGEADEDEVSDPILMAIVTEYLTENHPDMSKSTMYMNMLVTEYALLVQNKLSADGHIDADGSLTCKASVVRDYLKKNDDMGKDGSKANQAPPPQPQVSAPVPAAPPMSSLLPNTAFVSNNAIPAVAASIPNNLQAPGGMQYPAGFQSVPMAPTAAPPGFVNPYSFLVPQQIPHSQISDFQVATTAMNLPPASIPLNIPVVDDTASVATIDNNEDSFRKRVSSSATTSGDTPSPIDNSTASSRGSEPARHPVGPAPLESFFQPDKYPQTSKAKRQREISQASSTTDNQGKEDEEAWEADENRPAFHLDVNSTLYRELKNQESDDDDGNLESIPGIRGLAPKGKRKKKRKKKNSESSADQPSEVSTDPMKKNKKKKGSASPELPQVEEAFEAVTKKPHVDSPRERIETVTLDPVVKKQQATVSEEKDRASPAVNGRDSASPATKEPKKKSKKQAQAQGGHPPPELGPNKYQVVKKRFSNVSEHDLLAALKTLKGTHGMLNKLTIDQILTGLHRQLNHKKTGPLMDDRLYTGEDLHYIAPANRETESVQGTFVLLRNEESKAPWKTQKATFAKVCASMKTASIEDDGDSDATEDEEATRCAICLVGIKLFKATKLTCDHQFHRKCISRWSVEGERSCPMCRQHALLDEDFPSLSKAG